MDGQATGNGKPEGEHPEALKWRDPREIASVSEIERGGRLNDRARR